MHITPNSLNNVTKRSNGEESLQSRIHMIIFEQFFLFKICPSSNKEFKKDKLCKNRYFLEIELFGDFFGWIKGQLKNGKEFVFFERKR